jgi:hypothetical protein
VIRKPNHVPRNLSKLATDGSEAGSRFNHAGKCGATLDRKPKSGHPGRRSRNFE